MKRLASLTLSFLIIGPTWAQSPNSSKPGAPSAPSPNAEHQKSAFPGQTRAPQVTSTVKLNTTVIAKGLEYPWAVEVFPDGRLLVTEKPGRLRFVTKNGNMGNPIRGVPAVDDREQGGLLDVSLAPDFKKSRMLYLTYAEPRADNKNGAAVARARLSKDESALEGLEVIFRQEPAWVSAKHYGSRLVWSPDGKLFVTLGERSLPEPRLLAQDINTHLGKVIRLNADGSVPNDNPFVGNKQARAENWSYGHRNIQGADIHPETGQLWTIEHGPKGGDELNAPAAGKNYGWPVITYGEDYSGKPIGDDKTQMEGMEQPVYYWDPVIAPAGMAFYQGGMFDSWRGDLIVSSLKPGGLVRLELEKGKVTGEERLLENLGRVRDVAVDSDGALWVVTDEKNGRLVRITSTK